MNILLVETCRCCPEQYDIYYNDKQIGWFKLRHGIFRLMDIHNNEIFKHDFEDEWKEAFNNPVERYEFLMDCLYHYFVELIKPKVYYVE